MQVAYRRRGIGFKYFASKWCTLLVSPSRCYYIYCTTSCPSGLQSTSCHKGQLLAQFGVLQRKFSIHHPSVPPSLTALPSKCQVEITTDHLDCPSMRLHHDKVYTCDTAAAQLHTTARALLTKDVYKCRKSFGSQRRKCIPLTNLDHTCSSWDTRKLPHSTHDLKLPTKPVG